MRTLLFLYLVFMTEVQARRSRRPRHQRHKRPTINYSDINHEYFKCVSSYLCPETMSLESCRHEATRVCSARYWPEKTSKYSKSLFRMQHVTRPWKSSESFSTDLPLFNFPKLLKKLSPSVKLQYVNRLYRGRPIAPSRLSEFNSLFNC